MSGLDPEVVLPLYRAAIVKKVRFLSPDKNSWDDLTQEGYIAAWRALKTYSPERGALPSWIMLKVDSRIRSLVTGSGWLGSPKPSVMKPVIPTTSVSLDFTQDTVIGLMDSLQTSQSCEYVAMRYHSGEIVRALNELSPVQREIVVRVFWARESLTHISLSMGKQRDYASQTLRLAYKKLGPKLHELVEA